MKTFLTLIVVSIGCFALTTQDAITKGDPYKTGPTYDKLATIDVANKLLPVLLTKEQISKLLFKIEDCRKNVRNQEKKEADALLKFKDEIDKVEADAKTGAVPSPEFLARVNAMFQTNMKLRTGVNGANGLILKDWLKTNLNNGQIKAITEVINKVYDEETKSWAPGDSERRLMFYSLQILMSDNGYQFLIERARKM